ncbi:MAG: phosphatidate cytidylyltransferase [Gemmatimonadota bacterium]|jgi:phosphatidate cytidylyltransferase
MAASDLGRRVAVALVGIPLVLGALYLGSWVLGGLVAVVAWLAAREFYGLARARGVRPFAAVGALAAGALVLLATAYPTPVAAAPPAAAVLVVVTLLSLAGAVWLRWPGGEPMAAVGATVTGVVYIGFTLAFVPFLRWLPATAPGALGDEPWRATAFVLLPLATTWVGDAAAYFAGSAWGRRKLAPTVSPGKTVVGAVAGIVGAGLAGAAVAAWALSRLPALTVPVLTAAWIGALLGAVAQVGDLAESALKREAGVKDSGDLLPGHGGMLDRVDSLLFAFPTTWGLLLLAGVL